MKLKEDSFVGDFTTSTLMIIFSDLLSEKDFRFQSLEKLIPSDTVFHEYTEEADIFGNPKDKKGIEINHHITIAYKMNFDDYFKVKEVVQKHLPFDIELGTIGFFRHPDEPNDVCFLDLKSPELMALSDELREKFEFSKKWDYNPHITISYINKGKLEELEGQEINGLTGEKITVDKIEFILPDKQKLPIEAIVNNTLKVKLKVKENQVELNEAFDSSLSDIKVISKEWDMDLKTAMFEIKIPGARGDFIVDLNQIRDNCVNVSFMYFDPRKGMNGDGMDIESFTDKTVAGKIFTFVKKALFKYLEKFKDTNCVNFGAKTNQPSRVRLYKTLSKILSKYLGWDVRELDKKGIQNFEVFKSSNILIEGKSPNYRDPYSYCQNNPETFDSIETSDLAFRNGFSLDKTYQGIPFKNKLPKKISEMDSGGISGFAPENALKLVAINSNADLSKSLDQFEEMIDSLLDKL